MSQQRQMIKSMGGHSNKPKTLCEEDGEPSFGRKGESKEDDQLSFDEENSKQFEKDFEPASRTNSYISIRSHDQAKSGARASRPNPESSFEFECHRGTSDQYFQHMCVQIFNLLQIFSQKSEQTPGSKPISL